MESFLDCPFFLDLFVHAEVVALIELLELTIVQKSLVVLSLLNAFELAALGIEFSFQLAPVYFVAPHGGLEGRPDFTICEGAPVEALKPNVRF